MKTGKAVDDQFQPMRFFLVMEDPEGSATLAACLWNIDERSGYEAEVAAAKTSFGELAFTATWEEGHFRACTYCPRSA